MLKKIRNLYLISIIVGSIGYVLGLITAPKSGKDLIKDIEATNKENLVKLEKQLKIQYVDLSKQLLELEDILDASTTATAKKINEFITHSKKSLEKSKYLLSALHEGTADNQELITVIDEIKELKSSIKKYFRAN